MKRSNLTKTTSIIEYLNQCLQNSIHMSQLGLHQPRNFILNYSPTNY